MQQSKENSSASGHGEVTPLPAPCPKITARRAAKRRRLEEKLLELFGPETPPRPSTAAPSTTIIPGSPPSSPVSTRSAPQVQGQRSPRSSTPSSECQWTPSAKWSSKKPNATARRRIFRNLRKDV